MTEDKVQDKKGMKRKLEAEKITNIHDIDSLLPKRFHY